MQRPNFGAGYMGMPMANMTWMPQGQAAGFNMAQQQPVSMMGAMQQTSQPGVPYASHTMGQVPVQPMAYSSYQAPPSTGTIQPQMYQQNQMQNPYSQPPPVQPSLSQYNTVAPSTFQSYNNRQAQPYSSNPYISNTSYSASSVTPNNSTYPSTNIAQSKSTYPSYPGANSAQGQSIYNMPQQPTGYVTQGPPSTGVQLQGGYGVAAGLGTGTAAQIPATTLSDQPLGPKAPWQTCDVCNINFKDEKSYDQHCLGLLHQRKKNEKEEAEEKERREKTTLMTIKAAPPRGILKKRVEANRDVVDDIGIKDSKVADSYDKARNDKYGKQNDPYDVYKRHDEARRDDPYESRRDDQYRRGDLYYRKEDDSYKDDAYRPGKEDYYGSRKESKDDPYGLRKDVSHGLRKDDRDGTQTDPYTSGDKTRVDPYRASTDDPYGGRTDDPTIKYKESDPYGTSLSESHRRSKDRDPYLEKESRHSSRDTVRHERDRSPLEQSHHRDSYSHADPYEKGSDRSHSKERLHHADRYADHHALSKDDRSHSRERSHHKDPYGHGVNEKSYRERSPHKDPYGQSLDDRSHSRERLHHKDPYGHSLNDRSHSKERSHHKDPYGQSVDDKSHNRETLHHKDPYGHRVEEKLLQERSHHKDPYGHSLDERSHSRERSHQKDPYGQSVDEKSHSRETSHQKEDLYGQGVDERSHSRKRSHYGDPYADDRSHSRERLHSKEPYGHILDDRSHSRERSHHRDPYGPVDPHEGGHADPLKHSVKERSHSRERSHHRDPYGHDDLHVPSSHAAGNTEDLSHRSHDYKDPYYRDDPKREREAYSRQDKHHDDYRRHDKDYAAAYADDTGVDRSRERQAEDIHRDRSAHNKGQRYPDRYSDPYHRNEPAFRTDTLRKLDDVPREDPYLRSTDRHGDKHERTSPKKTELYDPWNLDNPTNITVLPGLEPDFVAPEKSHRPDGHSMSHGPDRKDSDYPPRSRGSEFPSRSQDLDYPPRGRDMDYPPRGRNTDHPPRGRESNYPERDRAAGFASTDTGHPATGRDSDYPVRSRDPTDYHRRPSRDGPLVETTPIPGLELASPSPSVDLPGFGFASDYNRNKDSFSKESYISIRAKPTFPIDSSMPSHSVQAQIPGLSTLQSPPLHNTNMDPFTASYPGSNRNITSVQEKTHDPLTFSGSYPGSTRTIPARQDLPGSPANTGLGAGVPAVGNPGLSGHGKPPGSAFSQPSLSNLPESVTSIELKPSSGKAEPGDPFRKNILQVCKICDLTIDGIKNFQCHVAGKKHLKALILRREEYEPKEFFELFKTDCINIPTVGQFPKSLLENLMMDCFADQCGSVITADERERYKELVKKTGTDTRFYCEVCPKTLGSMELWVPHVMGKVHAKKCMECIERMGKESYLKRFGHIPGPSPFLYGADFKMETLQSAAKKPIEPPQPQGNQLQPQKRHLSDHPSAIPRGDPISVIKKSRLNDPEPPSTNPDNPVKLESSETAYKNQPKIVFHAASRNAPKPEPKPVSPWDWRPSPDPTKKAPIPPPEPKKNTGAGRGGGKGGQGPSKTQPPAAQRAPSSASVPAFLTGVGGKAFNPRKKKKVKVKDAKKFQGSFLQPLRLQPLASIPSNLSLANDGKSVQQVSPATVKKEAQDVQAKKPQIKLTLHKPDKEIPAKKSETPEKKDEPQNTKPSSPKDSKPVNESAGQSKGQTQDKIQGQTPNKAQEQSPHKQEIQPQGLAQSKPQSKPQEQTASKPQGQTANRVQGQTQNKPQGQTQNKPQGQTQNKPQGQTQNKPQGQIQNKPQGQTQNKPQGQTQNKPQGQTQNKPQGQSQNKPQGQSQNKPLGHTQNMSESKPQELTQQTQNKPQSKSQGQSQVIAKPIPVLGQKKQPVFIKPLQSPNIQVQIQADGKKTVTNQNVKQPGKSAASTLKGKEENNSKNTGEVKTPPQVASLQKNTSSKANILITVCDDKKKDIKVVEVEKKVGDLSELLSQGDTDYRPVTGTVTGTADTDLRVPVPVGTRDVDYRQMQPYPKLDDKSALVSRSTSKAQDGHTESRSSGHKRSPDRRDAAFRRDKDEKSRTPPRRSRSKSSKRSPKRSPVPKRRLSPDRINSPARQPKVSKEGSSKEAGTSRRELSREEARRDLQRAGGARNEAYRDKGARMDTGRKVGARRELQPPQRREPRENPTLQEWQRKELLQNLPSKYNPSEVEVFYHSLIASIDNLIRRFREAQTYNLDELMDMLPMSEHQLVYSIQDMTGVDDLALAARVTIVLRGMDPDVVQILGSLDPALLQSLACNDPEGHAAIQDLFTALRGGRKPPVKEEYEYEYEDEEREMATGGGYREPEGGYRESRGRQRESGGYRGLGRYQGHGGTGRYHRGRGQARGQGYYRGTNKQQHPYGGHYSGNRQY